MSGASCSPACGLARSGASPGAAALAPVRAGVQAGRVCGVLQVRAQLARGQVCPARFTPGAWEAAGHGSRCWSSAESSHLGHRDVHARTDTHLCAQAHMLTHAQRTQAHTLVHTCTGCSCNSCSCTQCTHICTHAIYAHNTCTHDTQVHMYIHIYLVYRC